MAERPKLLDAFCGAGGASAGYDRAGFDVTGVDNRPMPRYPFRFVLGDALEYITAHGREYDAIAASPPCQRYSVGSKRWPGRGEHHPDLVAAVREAVRLTRRPYVIENVRGAPLRGAVLLCGAMFDLRVYRHRLFESNVLLMVPPHPRHRESTGAHRGYSYRHPFVCVAGHNFHLAEGKAAMGITWMGTRRELSQAVPPAYTHHLGLQLRRYLEDTPDA